MAARFSVTLVTRLTIPPAQALPWTGREPSGRDEQPSGRSGGPARLSLRPRPQPGRELSGRQGAGRPALSPPKGSGEKLAAAPPSMCSALGAGGVGVLLQGVNIHL